MVVGSLSSLVWPAIVVLIPAGITFAAARVYAEGSPPPLACDAPPILACADAGERALCSPGRYNSLPGVCLGVFCGDGGGPSDFIRRGCYDVQFCKDVSAASCVGKREGASCGTGGTCTGHLPHAECYDIVADAGVNNIILDCVVDAGDASVDPNGCPDLRGDTCQSKTNNGGDPCVYDGGPGHCAESACRQICVPGAVGLDPGAAADAGPAATSPEDSGCASSPGSASGTAALLGVPFAVGLLLAVRRRKRREKR